MNCNFRRNKNVDFKMKITATGPSASLHYIKYCFSCVLFLNRNNNERVHANKIQGWL